MMPSLLKHNHEINKLSAKCELDTNINYNYIKIQKVLKDMWLNK